MVKRAAHPVLRFIHSVALACADTEALDEELVRRYATHHDDNTFAALVRRHGPMVDGVGTLLSRPVQQRGETAVGTAPKAWHSAHVRFPGKIP